MELLLAQAYARRDHVALMAFRGTEAELLLPPTRSLVQTKRGCAGLPGGGGTPLAAALKLAAETALRGPGARDDTDAGAADRRARRISRWTAPPAARRPRRMPPQMARAFGAARGGSAW